MDGHHNSSRFIDIARSRFFRRLAERERPEAKTCSPKGVNWYHINISIFIYYHSTFDRGQSRCSRLEVLAGFDSSSLLDRPGPV